MFFCKEAWLFLEYAGWEGGRWVEPSSHLGAD